MTELWNRAGSEPTIEELLADPICRRIMQHDGIGIDDVWAVIRRAGRDRAGTPSDATLSRHPTPVDYLVEAHQMRDEWMAQIIIRGLNAIGRQIRRSVDGRPLQRLLRGPELLSRA